MNVDNSYPDAVVVKIKSQYLLKALRILLSNNKYSKCCCWHYYFLSGWVKNLSDLKHKLLLLKYWREKILENRCYEIFPINSIYDFLILSIPLCFSFLSKMEWNVHIYYTGARIGIDTFCCGKSKCNSRKWISWAIYFTTFMHGQR